MTTLRASINRTYSRTRNTVSRLYDQVLLVPGIATGTRIAHTHFRQRNLTGHVNQIPMTKALRLLRSRRALIVETGSSAHGTDSTRLWARYVELFGGLAFSVDISSEPSEKLGNLGSSVSLHVDDSVNFLRRFELPDGFQKIDLLFLDSWDVDLANPQASMDHGRSELLAAMGCLTSGSLVLIDDTPQETSLWGQNDKLAEEYRLRTGLVPGKGSTILNDDELMSHFEVLHHSYSVLLRHR